MSSFALNSRFSTFGTESRRKFRIKQQNQTKERKLTIRADHPNGGWAWFASRSPLELEGGSAGRGAGFGVQGLGFKGVGFRV